MIDIRCSVCNKYMDNMTEIGYPMSAKLTRVYFECEHCGAGNVYHLSNDKVDQAKEVYQDSLVVIYNKEMIWWEL